MAEHKAEMFYVSTTNHDWLRHPKRYIGIALYETREEMVEAANHHVRAHGEYFDNECMAVFHPLATRIKYGKGGKTVWQNGKHYIGTMRLNREDVSTEIIIHETMHAACAIYRADDHSTVHLGDDCNYREENLAYILGDLAASILTTLTNRGVLFS